MSWQVTEEELRGHRMCANKGGLLWMSLTKDRMRADKGTEGDHGWTAKGQNVS